MPSTRPAHWTVQFPVFVFLKPQDSKRCALGFAMSTEEIFPQRHLAFISLALGFLVIWTAVLAAVLVSGTLKEQAAAEEAIKLFHTHQDMGRISFSLGHELVSTVDWSVSDWPNQREAKSLTWNETDGILSSVKSRSSGRWLGSVAGVLDVLEMKLAKVRGPSSSRDPEETVRLYSELNDLLLKKAFLLDESSVGLPYTLFVQGMFQRFGELALGTAYVKTGLKPNKTLFLELRIGSEKLMEAAFRFTPRSHARWLELREPGVVEALKAVADDLLILERGDSRWTAASYLEKVKEQIAILLLTKEVLNTAAASRVDRVSGKSRSTLAFHLSVAVVAVGAVLVCLVVTGCTFMGLGRSESRRSDDKTHMLSDTFPKPHCYF